MSGQLSLSYRIDLWVEKLLRELEEKRSDPLATQIILVPNSLVKQWLLLEIAKREGVAMGIKAIEIEQLLPKAVDSLTMGAKIYQELRRSIDPDVLGYLGGKKGRLLELTEQLVSLFFTYGQFGKELFAKPPTNWQEKLLHKLFVEGPLRLPVQQSNGAQVPVIAFGIDFLPPIYWDFLFRAPSFSIYLFSPCVEFWEDLSSDRERKKLNRMWKKRNVSQKGKEALDHYLRSGPRNLANWGKLGRETLKNFDRIDLEIEEIYPSFEGDTLLKRIQLDLLTFQETKNPPVDSSVKLFLTGSSKLKEIQCLRDEIIRLNIPYSEVSVLAPHIEPYVPLIEYVFGDAIPYRISGLDIAPQSSFRQGLLRFIALKSGRWDVEELFTLFETPSFYRKQRWDREEREQLREWATGAKIRWGIDLQHRKETLSRSLGEEDYGDFGSWEKGLDFLLHSMVHFSDVHLDYDLFEEFVQVIESLKSFPLSGEKTLHSWAESLALIAERFLEVDLDDEADSACFHAFHQLLVDLRNSEETELFPLELIQRFLLRPCFGSIHSTHLHAVRFAPLQEGALLPARALFLIGMSEEEFPRERRSSSLDLLKGAVPDGADRDRYLFLQSLFSAKEFLRLSYGHLSPDEGKPVGPSLLIQELLNGIDLKPEVYQAPPPVIHSPSLPWPLYTPSPLPEGEKVISIADLRQLARHPWKFYLAKGMGLHVETEWDDSFALQKGGALRATLEKTVEVALGEREWISGPLGQALQLDVVERSAEWKEQLARWGVEPFSLVFRQNCEEAHWEEGKYIAPPIELNWEKLKVLLVGEISHASQKGLINPNDDTIGGNLKVWPEALLVAIALEAPQILMLKSGKEKKIEGAALALQQFLEYYFAALKAPSPLLPDWADSLLRKGGADLEKKMEKGAPFEDPLLEWVLARGKVATASELVATWEPFLKERFTHLIELYPTRGKHHAAV